MKLANLTIGTRLSLGFAIVLALAMLITGIGIRQLRAVGDATRAMMQEPLTKERLISDWSRNLSVGVARTTAIAKSSDASLSPFFAKDAAILTKSTAELLKQIEPLISAADEQAVMAQITEVRKAYIASRDKVGKLKADGLAEQANEVLVNAFIPAAEGYSKRVADLLSLQRARLDAMAVEIARIESSSQTGFLALAAFVLGFGVLCAWRLTVGITAPLQVAVAVAPRGGRRRHTPADRRRLSG